MRLMTTLLLFIVVSSSAKSDLASRILTSGLDARDACFGLYADKQRLGLDAVFAASNANSEAECSHRCRRHHQSPLKCRFYSYGRSDGSCHLSRAHRHNLTLVMDPDFDVFERLNYCLKGHRGFTEQLPRVHKAFEDKNKNNKDESIDKDDRPEALAQLVHSGVCFVLALSSRRLADSLILKSVTAFDLEQCMDACLDNTDFHCKAFAFRMPDGAQELLNCDLTDKDTSELDKYSSHHFYESALTDFYEIDVTANVCHTPIHTLDTTHKETLETDHLEHLGQRLGQGASRECYGRIRTGFKHYIYRDHRNVFSASHCSDKCRSLSFCRTFSFRYGPIRADENGNCLLSDKRGLELLDADLEISNEDEGDWDVFELRSSPICDQQPDQSSQPDLSETECRELIRGDSTLSSHIVSDKVTTASLRFCTNVCRQDDSCLLFAFSPRSGQCRLARVSALASDDLRDDDDASVYRLVREKCDQRPSVSAIEEEDDDDGFDNVFFDESTADTGLRQCHRRTRVGFRHTSDLLLAQLDLQTVALCSHQCRLNPDCHSFSFRYQRAGGRGLRTCLLSDQTVGEALDNGSVRPDTDWDFYESIENCNDNEKRASSWSSSSSPCYPLLRVGLKHRRSTASHALHVVDVHECWLRCRRQVLPPCNSFSFLNEDNRDTNNCLISPLRPIEASDTRDLSLQSNWRVYENNRRRECSQHERPSDSCYRRVRGGYRLRSSSSSQRVSSLQQCSESCRSIEFCIVFAFTKDSATLNNCELMSGDSLDLNFDLDPDSEWDVYELLDTCEEDLDHVCYDVERRGVRHQGSVVRAFLRTRNERACSTECRAAPFCHSFSYRSISSVKEDNCLLTNIKFDRAMDNTRNLVRSPEWNVYSIDLRCDDRKPGFPNECARRDRRGFRFDATAITSELRVSRLTQCSQACHQQTSCKAFAFKSGGGAEVRCQLSSLPITSLFGRDLEEAEQWDIYEKLFVKDPDTCKEEDQLDDHDESACYKRVYGGRRHGVESLVDTLRTDSLAICGLECGRHVGCRTFSYSSQSSPSLDNCLISLEDVDKMDDDLLEHSDQFSVYDYNHLEAECVFYDQHEHSILPTNLPCLRLIESRARLRPERAIAVIRVDDVDECHRACRTNSKCHSFSFSERGLSDACLLSSSRFNTLEGKEQLERDSSSSVYQLRFGSNCKSSTYPQPPLAHIPVVPEPHCYQILASGHTLRSSTTLTTYSLSECSSICSSRPTCHLLAFSSTRLIDNCLINEGNAQERLMVVGADFDVYERREAEECLHNIGPPPPPFDEGMRTRCHRVLLSEGRLRAAVVATQVADVRECEQLCIRATTIRCSGFAFRFRSLGSAEPNCELTDVSLDIISHSVVFDPIWSVFVRVDFDGVCGSSEHVDDHLGLNCYSLYRSSTSVLSQVIVEHTSASSVMECGEHCDSVRARSIRGCKSFVFLSSSQACLLTDVGHSMLETHVVHDPRAELWTSSGHCHQSSDPQRSVSGRLCRSRPRLESRAGYWYCETQDDPVGWDYCCRPGQYCGHSRHDEYAWCFVGEQGRDQWRPCQPSWNNGHLQQNSHMQNSHTENSFKAEYSAPPNYKAEYSAPPKYRVEELTALSLTKRRPDKQNMAPDREATLSPIVSVMKDDAAILKFG